MTLSNQADPDMARMRRELERDLGALTTRVRDLETFKAYVTRTLLPYLDGLAAVVGYPPAPRP